MKVWKSGKQMGKYADFLYTMCPALRQPVFASWPWGAVFVTVRNSSKMADSTSNDTAAPQSAYSTGAESAAPAENFAMAQAENAAIEAEMAETAADMPEGAVAEVTAGTDGAVTGNLQAAQKMTAWMRSREASPL